MLYPFYSTGTIFYLSFHLLNWALPHLWAIFCYCFFHLIAVVTTLTPLAWQRILTTVHWYCGAFVHLYTEPLTALTQGSVLGALLCTVIALICAFILLHHFQRRDQWNVRQQERLRQIQEHFFQNDERDHDFLPVRPMVQQEVLRQPRPVTLARAPQPRPVPRPRETPKAAWERRLILATFQCPFEIEGTACRRTKRRRCAFSHQTGAQQQAAANLKNLPSYLCTYNLLNICTSPTPEDCINGLHLTAFTELLNLADFERRNQNRIDRYFGADRNRQCYICQEIVLEKVLAQKRQFAILENCTHVFCAECLQRWAVENFEFNYQLQSRNEVSCPVCRTISRRFLIRRRFTENPQQKQTLFAAAAVQPVQAR